MKQRRRLRRRRGTGRARLRAPGAVSTARWTRWFPGRRSRRSSSRTISKARVTEPSRCRWNGCCGSTSCSSGFNPVPILRPRIAAVRLRVDAALCRDLSSLDDAVPDESTILRFRHLLEQHKLDGAHLWPGARAARAEAAAAQVRHDRGCDDHRGTELPRAKNAARARDPEMRQTRKGKGWHFLA